MLGVFLSFYITRPLKRAVEFAKEVSKGIFDNTIEVDSKDELGELTISLNNLARTVKDILNEFKQVIEKIGLGYLDYRADVGEKQGYFREFVEGVNNMVDTFENMLNKMPIIVSIMDKELNLRYINNSGLKLINRELNHIRSKKCFELFPTPHCNTENCACVTSMKKKDRVVSETTLDISGNKMDISYIGSPLMDKNGNIYGVMEIIIDETKIKKYVQDITVCCG